jgi:hypothetical protein
VAVGTSRSAHVARICADSSPSIDGQSRRVHWNLAATLAGTPGGRAATARWVATRSGDGGRRSGRLTGALNGRRPGHHPAKTCSLPHGRRRFLVLAEPRARGQTLRTARAHHRAAHCSRSTRPTPCISPVDPLHGSARHPSPSLRARTAGGLSSPYMVRSYRTNRPGWKRVRR